MKWKMQKRITGKQIKTINLIAYGNEHNFAWTKQTKLSDKGSTVNKNRRLEKDGKKCNTKDT